MDELAVSVERAAQMIGISRATLYPHVMAGEVPSFRLGGRRLVLVEALRAWAEKQAAGAAG